MPDTARAKRRYSIFFGCMVFMLLVVVFYGLFSTAIRNQQEQFAMEMHRDYASIVQDVQNTLLPLNKLNYTTCAPENLRAMEAALFRSAYSRQIMFYENGAGVCTTGTGMLASPIKQSPPDFIAPGYGGEVWANREITLDLTGDTFNASITRIGNYSIMHKPDILQSRRQFPFDWKLVFKDPGKPGKVIDVFSGFHDGVAGQDTLPDYFLEYCDSERPYFCLQVPTSQKQLAGQYSQVILLMLAVSMALGYIGENKAYRWLQNRVQLKTRVARGFRKDAIYWLYQPIVDLRTKKVVGCEVLTRFRDKYGELMPKEFLPCIREAGLTAEFTRRMIRRVMPELENCTALPGHFKVSLNIFPVDIKTGNINDILQLPEIANARFRIALEIIEDEELDEESARLNLSKVHENNLLLSIDDFGTGYSNLKQIRKLDASFLKIDQSYVMDLEDKPVRASLIPHIISMAKELGIEVIAEGIETETQRAILYELGVTYGQGWLFGKAMKAEELAAAYNCRSRPRGIPRLNVVTAS